MKNSAHYGRLMICNLHSQWPAWRNLERHRQNGCPMAALRHLSGDIGKAIDLQTNVGLAAKRQPWLCINSAQLAPWALTDDFTQAGHSARCQTL